MSQKRSNVHNAEIVKNQSSLRPTKNKEGIDIMYIYMVNYGADNENEPKFFSTLDKAREFAKKQYPIEAQKLVDEGAWEEEEIELEDFLEDISEDCEDRPINKYGFADIYNWSDLILITKYPLD
jgi:hypothetical protein